MTMLMDESFDGELLVQRIECLEALVLRHDLDDETPGGFVDEGSVTERVQKLCAALKPLGTLHSRHSTAHNPGSPYKFSHDHPHTKLPNI